MSHLWEIHTGFILHGLSGQFKIETLCSGPKSKLRWLMFTRIFNDNSNSGDGMKRNVFQNHENKLNENTTWLWSRMLSRESLASVKINNPNSVDLMGRSKHLIWLNLIHSRKHIPRNYCAEFGSIKCVGEKRCGSHKFPSSLHTLLVKFRVIKAIPKIPNVIRPSRGHGEGKEKHMYGGCAMQTYIHCGQSSCKMPTPMTAPTYTDVSNHVSVGAYACAPPVHIHHHVFISQYEFPSVRVSMSMRGNTLQSDRIEWCSMIS